MFFGALDYLLRGYLTKSTQYYKGEIIVVVKHGAHETSG